MARSAERPASPEGPERSERLGRPEPDRLAAELFRAFEADPSPVVEFLDWLAARYGLAGPDTGAGTGARRPGADPPRVLDMGCGTGRVLGPLARWGWRVTGMEPHPGFRAAAREVGEPLGAPVWRGGFNDLSRREAFDLIIACNSSFAHLVTPERRADALRRCREALRPGGVLLLDVPHYLWILYHYRPPRDVWAEWRGRPVRLRREHEVDTGAATFTTRETYAVFEEGAEVGPVGAEVGPEAGAGRERHGSRAPSPLFEHQMVHVYAMITYPELVVALERAGFDRPATFSSYAARDPEPLEGERMMVAARRAGP